MEDTRELLYVTDENGKEIECEIVLTFENEDNHKCYVVYQIVGDDSGEVYAASYDPDDEGEGRLYPIESDEEWEFVEQVLEEFDSEEDDCDCDHDHEEEDEE